MLDEHQKVGTVAEGQAGVRYELVISEFIKPLIIPHDIEGLTSIDPYDYFITSGDAIKKTDQLYRDIAQLGRSIQQVIQGGSTSILMALDVECTEALQGCLKMKQALENSRGKAIFLETDWIENKLVVIPKNPRLKDK